MLGEFFKQLLNAIEGIVGGAAETGCVVGNKVKVKKRHGCYRGPIRFEPLSQPGGSPNGPDPMELEIMTPGHRTRPLHVNVPSRLA